MKQIKALFKLKNISLTLHILIWGGILLFPYIISSPDNNYEIGRLPGWFFSISGLIHIVIFYGNAYFLYPKLFTWRLWFLYIPASILLIIASFRLKYYILVTWLPEVLLDPEPHKFIFAPSVGVFVISVVYRIVIDKIRAEKEQKERQAEQLSTQLKFLRSQISPHFLFNVLTNLVSLARKKSDRLEPALIKLSELMRYMLYYTGKKVELQKEVEYLNSYIELQKLRFGNDVRIDYHSDLDDDDNNSYTIEPMLLIPFVENAFKHGTGYIDNPCIVIGLSVSNGKLIFDVKNKFDQEMDTSKDDNSGIGLSNVRSRLNLLYKGRHSLKVSDNNNLFHIILTLDLL